MTDPLHDSRNPNHGRVGGLYESAPMGEREELKGELNYWLRVIGDRMGANDRRFSDMVRDLKDMLAVAQPVSQSCGGCGEPGYIERIVKNAMDTARRETIKECAKIAEVAMDNAISRGRALDKRSRDFSKEVAREYTARGISGCILRLNNNSNSADATTLATIPEQRGAEVSAPASPGASAPAQRPRG